MVRHWDPCSHTSTSIVCKYEIHPLAACNLLSTEIRLERKNIRGYRFGRIPLCAGYSTSRLEGASSENAFPNNVVVRSSDRDVVKYWIAPNFKR